MKNKWDFQTVLTVRGVMAISLLFALTAAAYTETTNLKHNVILYLNSWSAIQEGPGIFNPDWNQSDATLFCSCVWSFFSLQTYLNLWAGSQTTASFRNVSCKKVTPCSWEVNAHSNYSQSASCACPTLLRVCFPRQLHL